MQSNPDVASAPDIATVAGTADGIRHIESKDRLTSFINITVAIVTVIGVIFTVFVYFYDKKNKDIRITILESSAFFQNKADFGQSVSINVGEKKVEQLWYAKLRYENAGKLPIKRDDIEVGTKILFSGSEVLSASIPDKNPKNLDFEIRNSLDTIQLGHGLINPGDYVIIDVLVSGTRRPEINCDYRISDIARCAVRDESAASKEFYIVGTKTDEKWETLAVILAFATSLLVAGSLAYVVISTLGEWIQKTIAMYRTKSIEDALSLFGKDFSEKTKGLRLLDKGTFQYASLALRQSVKDLMKDAGPDVTIGNLLDEARLQPISASLSYDIQKTLADLIDAKTRYVYPINWSIDKITPNKLVDFEKEAITGLLSARYRIDQTGIKVAFPLLVLALNMVFVCAGPLRTLLQKWV
jgi:hypothetical protein